MKNREFFTPRQVAVALGVSESSLKRWADRGLLPVARTAGGHRRIPLAGLVEFIRTTRTPIANPEAIGLYLQKPSRRGGSPNDAGDFFEALHEGNLRRCSGVVLGAYLAGWDTWEICDRMIRPAMVRLGELWEVGELDPYEEHRAALVSRLLLWELRGMAAEPAADAPVAVGAAGPGDPYALPTAMVEVVLSGLGWRATDLGADTPVASVGAAARALGAGLVWMSFSSQRWGEELAEQVSELAEECRREGRLLVIGGRTLTDGVRAAARGAKVCECMSDLRRVVSRNSDSWLGDAADVIGL